MQGKFSFIHLSHFQSFTLQVMGGACERVLSSEVLVVNMVVEFSMSSTPVGNTCTPHTHHQPQTGGRGDEARRDACEGLSAVDLEESYEMADSYPQAILQHLCVA